MRMIGTVPGEAEAQRFTAYLLTHKIDASAEKADVSEQWLIWVEHDDLLDRGREELAAFNANPRDPKYAVEGLAQKIRREKDAAADRRRKNFTDVRTKWAATGRAATPVTIALIAICVLVFLFGQGDEKRANQIQSALAFEPPMSTDVLSRDFSPAELRLLLVGTSQSAWAAATESIRHGQVWRVVTPIFSHGGLGHIFFNMMWLVFMGARLEARKGPWLMLAVVLIGAVVSNCGEAAWEVFGMLREDKNLAATLIKIIGTPFLGMSGVNYAIFGFIWIYGRLRPHDGLQLRPQDIGLAIGWLVICMTGLVGNIANAAHVMGLATGVAMAWIYVRGFRRRRAPR